MRPGFIQESFPLNLETLKEKMMFFLVPELRKMEHLPKLLYASVNAFYVGFIDFHFTIFCE